MKRSHSPEQESREAFEAVARSLREYRDRPDRLRALPLSADCDRLSAILEYVMAPVKGGKRAEQ